VPYKIVAAQVLPVVPRQIGNRICEAEIPLMPSRLDNLPLSESTISESSCSLASANNHVRLTFILLPGTNCPNSRVSVKMEKYSVSLNSHVSVSVPKYNFPVFFASSFSCADALSVMIEKRMVARTARDRILNITIESQIAEDKQTRKKIEKLCTELYESYTNGEF
jgi:hypothetical protein